MSPRASIPEKGQSQEVARDFIYQLLCTESCHFFKCIKASHRRRVASNYRGTTTDLYRQDRYVFEAFFGIPLGCSLHSAVQQAITARNEETRVSQAIQPLQDQAGPSTPSNTEPAVPLPTLQQAGRSSQSSPAPPPYQAQLPTAPAATQASAPETALVVNMPPTPTARPVRAVRPAVARIARCSCYARIKASPSTVIFFMILVLAWYLTTFWLIDEARKKENRRAGYPEVYNRGGMAWWVKALGATGCTQGVVLLFMAFIKSSTGY